MKIQKTGFTLIEVMLSLFITALLISILAVVFNTGLRAYRQGKDLIEITRKGQLILGQITKELKGAMVQKDGTTIHIPFQGTNTDIRFVAPLENSGDIDLCGVKYSFSNNNLWRLVNVFNKSRGDVYPDELIDFSTDGYQFCEGVTAFRLQYNNGTVWTPSWTDTAKLPTIVEAQVTIQGKYGNPKQEKIFTTWIYLPNSTNN